MIVAALAYLERGWSVIPGGPDKRPLVRWKDYQEERPSEKQLWSWWAQWPQANVIVVTGKISNLSVIDLDGEEGVESAKKLNFPKTYTVQTPSGGWHLYYTYCSGLHTGARFKPGLDIRSEGGYVVAPPSVISGKSYVVKRNMEVGEFTLPQSALARENGHRTSENTVHHPSWVSEAIRGVSGGERNSTATRLAGYFHARGLRQGEIEAIMDTFAARCQPPMDRRELSETIRSVLRYPNGARGAVDLEAWGYRGELLL